VIYILFALLAGLGWAIWFILRLHWWIPTVVTGVMAVAAIILFIYRRVKAKRAANALERALAQQGEMQVRNARPERRAEIQQLQKQLQDGITALKSSKLGGKKRGGAALYALPWYAIIGPPGAGKTTALRHSGLVFPYADSAVRGVGWAVPATAIGGSPTRPSSSTRLAAMPPSRMIKPSGSRSWTCCASTAPTSRSMA
jgi:type VI secretion system protein ImpL